MYIFDSDKAIVNAVIRWFGS